MKSAFLPFKSDLCFAALDERGFCSPKTPRAFGMFLHDARHLSTYQWRFDGFEPLDHHADLSGLSQFWSLFDDGAQQVLLHRRLRFRPDGFDETFTFVNESAGPVQIHPILESAADFIDVFELRDYVRGIGKADVIEDVSLHRRRYRYVAQDGVVAETELQLDGLNGEGALTVPKGGSAVMTVAARFSSTLSSAAGTVSAIAWSDRAIITRDQAPTHVAQAWRDVDALAIGSPHGPIIAAGVPNYVALFGRDSLITALLLLEAAPDVAHATLANLAVHQGQRDDPVTLEAKGKIPHEIRAGELSRCGDLPFACYYGTTDATALFVILAHAYGHQMGDLGALDRFRDAIGHALSWLESEQDAQGFIRYPTARAGRGLINTSWKDSDDSISYHDGALAEGRIAVVEIQGYLVAAFEAGAVLHDHWGLEGEATRLRAKAADLRHTIDAAFWDDELGLHAIAIDEAGRRCNVASSNPGHLLWVDAALPERREAMIARLTAPDMWSGWGLRTLSSQAARYQPLSYHNGSIWPHDTAIFALGALRSGDRQTCARARDALRAIAYRQTGAHLPELFGGYARDGDVPPLVYIETCQPQAWAAAALIALEMEDLGERD